MYQDEINNLLINTALIRKKRTLFIYHKNEINKYIYIYMQCKVSTVEYTFTTLRSIEIFVNIMATFDHNMLV